MNLAAFNRMVRRLVAHRLSYTHDEKLYTVHDSDGFVKFYFYILDIDEYIVYNVKPELFASRKKYPEFQRDMLIERFKDIVAYLYYDRPERLSEISSKFRDCFSSVEIVDNKQLVRLLRNADIYHVTIKRLFMEDGDEYEDSDLNFKHKGWTVRLFDKNFTHSDAVSCLNNVEKRLGSRLKYLCYGNVNFIEEDASSNVIAFYDGEKDDITVIIYSRLVYNIIHELGHRLYKLFLNEEQVSAIGKKYEEYVFEMSDLKLKKGDIVKTNDGLTLEILDDDIFMSEGLPYNRGRLLEDIHDSTHFNISETKYYYLPKERIKYINKKRIPVEFPSEYSKTQQEEFFSEIFSTWCFNRLNRNDKAWIEGLLFNNNYGVKE